MQKKDCFLVGTIFKLHGYKGDVKIYNEDNIPFDFSKIDFFLIDINNELIPFFIKKARITAAHNILVNFDDVNCEKESKKILNKKIYLEKKYLPENYKETKNTEDIIGFSVIDMYLGKLGEIFFINSQTAQKLIYVKTEEKEFCFPWHEKFVKNIDNRKEEIHVELPDEILNLN